MEVSLAGLFDEISERYVTIFPKCTGFALAIAPKPCAPCRDLVGQGLMRAFQQFPSCFAVGIFGEPGHCEFADEVHRDNEAALA